MRAGVLPRDYLQENEVGCIKTVHVMDIQRT